MKPNPLPGITIDQLLSLFNKDLDNRLMLDADTGIGSIQLYKPEKGLQVSIWNCTFLQSMELHCRTPESEKHSYFNLVYFLDKQNQEGTHVSETSGKNVLWDNMFVSGASDCKLLIRRITRFRCVSVSSSKRWLLKAVETNCTLKTIHEISDLEKLELFQCMTPDERKMVENLVDHEMQNEFRHFYIKAAVFKLVYDFLAKLKDLQGTSASNNIAGILDKVEQCLCQHVTKEFAGIKRMAQQFSISESTLKRHFKKKYGVTVSTYMTTKKMQYARELIQDKGITLAEAARMVGYRNVQSFKEVFNKYCNGIPARQRKWCHKDVS